MNRTARDIEQQKMILHVTGSMAKTTGGPFVSVRRTLQVLDETGWNVAVVGMMDQSASGPRHEWRPIAVRNCKLAIENVWGVTGNWREIIEREAPAIVHVHGIWMAYTKAVLGYCVEREIPYIVSPRGMLEPWCLQYSRWKKRMIWHLWERRFVENAAVLHATSDAEQRHLRELGLRNRIAVIPNGVDVPPLVGSGEAVPRERIAVFISRLHPKKGLPLLLEAWSRVKPSGWKLIIAGPGEEKYRKEVVKTVERLGVSLTVSVLPGIYDEDKWELLRRASLFVFPSYSENFGIAVAEALASGVPVIGTTATPWECLVTERCGWWCAADVGEFSEAIECACGLDPVELAEMGRRGKRYVTERLSWEAIGDEIGSVYQWMLCGGRAPACVSV